MMRRQKSTPTRRTLLSAIGAGLTSGLVGTEATARRRTESQYVLVQSDECVPIRPISSNEPVIEFYGYKSGASESNSQQSNTGLEKAGVSQLFLYRGPNGLSLVLLHGGGDGERGGAASFEVTGLPPSGEWVVLDDSYEGRRDEYHISERRAVLHWAWGVDGQNDGAVFRGLADEFEIRITPAFNDAARFEPFGPGKITEWQVLSATDDDITTRSISLDQPVVLSSDEC